MKRETDADRSRTARLDAAVEHFLALRRANRPEPIERFVERYPDLAVDLRDVLPALDGLESLQDPIPEADPSSTLRTTASERSSCSNAAAGSLGRRVAGSGQRSAVS